MKDPFDASLSLFDVVFGFGAVLGGSLNTCNDEGLPLQTHFSPFNCDALKSENFV